MDLVFIVLELLQFLCLIHAILDYEKYNNVELSSFLLKTKIVNFRLILLRTNKLINLIKYDILFKIPCGIFLAPTQLIIPLLGRKKGGHWEKQLPQELVPMVPISQGRRLADFLILDTGNGVIPCLACQALNHPTQNFKRNKLVSVFFQLF